MFKNYKRLDSIHLPEFKSKKSELRHLLKMRQSFRDFTKTPISKLDLSEILFYSCGIKGYDAKTGQPNLTYPSGGAKYPLEVYPLVLHSTDIKRGLYHYDPCRHALDILLESVDSKKLNAMWLGQTWLKNSAVIVIITAVFHRTTEKYGEVGLKFPFLEAGHMCQNFYLISQSLQIGCCAVGNMVSDEVIKLLDINPLLEQPVYYLAIGN